MKKTLLFFLICYTALSYAQDKSVAFFDEQKKPIPNFQLNFFTKDSLAIYKSENNHIYRFKKASIKKVDSILIHYDSFYLHKISLNDFIEKDSLFFKKDISLDEIVINTKIERKELGVVSQKRSIRKLHASAQTDRIIAFNASDYVGTTVETISLYIYKNFRDIYNTRLSTKYVDLEFYLFQSDTSPNEGVVSLLEKPLIVNTEQSKKGWLTIDLKSLDIEIKDLKKLYLGFNTSGNFFSYGIVQRKKIILTDTITAYTRNLRATFDYDKIWKPTPPKSSHYNYPLEEFNEPAIKIKVRY